MFLILSSKLRMFDGQYIVSFADDESFYERLSSRIRVNNIRKIDLSCLRRSRHQGYKHDSLKPGKFSPRPTWDGFLVSIRIQT